MDETPTTSRIPSYRLDSLRKDDSATPPSPKEKNWMKVILVFLFVIITVFVTYTILIEKFPNNFNIFKQDPLSAPTTQEATPGATLETGTNPAKLVGVKADYLKLDDILYQLTKTSDVNEYSKKYELYIKKDSVRVEIQLNDTRFKLPNEFGIEEKRSGAFLTALVPISKLVELTEDIRIIAIIKP